ncbi:hypothetical protein DNTS_008260 [Danionella cerebrum]|uniref:Protein FAM217B n=1 Tax=Danionella cerebrum TaxID=2873325 RepID=A0A553R6D4_9TELE|nr:hypothetical protein DNTS_008260 [Danionella translucida]
MLAFAAFTTSAESGKPRELGATAASRYRHTDPVCDQLLIRSARGLNEEAPGASRELPEMGTVLRESSLHHEPNNRDPGAPRHADRQLNTNVKAIAASRNRQKEKRRRQNQFNEANKSELRSTARSSEHQTESWRCQHSPKEEDTTSDLSESELTSVLPAQISPPDLDLRAEVIDPSQFQASKRSSRGRDAFRASYPDFLPPPFNSWSLQQLAVYLNTEGRSIPRPKPIGQLERYLERLLQLEWHQIQTLQEDSIKSCARSHHPSLSSPKCILQCQRAFPLTLLSSLASAPKVSLSNCSCTQCKNQFPMLNGSLHQHTRLSRLLESSVRASGFPKRSCSESRALRSKPQRQPREHRLSDPLSESTHMRQMQAQGNMRNLNPVSSGAPGVRCEDEDDLRKRRSHSCLGSRVRGQGEQRKSNNVEVCFGNMFIRLPQGRTRSMILKDQEQIDKEINDLRKRLKSKVNRLNELQGKSELRGYSLTPLSSEEMKAINSLIQK